MKQKPTKRPRDPVEAKWKGIVDDIMEEKVNIGIDKLLRRGVRKMKTLDTRPEKLLREELRNVIDFDHLDGYMLNKDRTRMIKIDLGSSHSELEASQEAPEDGKAPEEGGEKAQQEEEQVEAQQEAEKEQEVEEEREKAQDKVESTKPQTVARNEANTAGSSETWRESLKRVDVKAGKFSKSEEDALREAVIRYAQKHGHSTDDFSWIIGKKEYRGNEARGIWAEVAASLPQRTIKAVAAAGVRLFHPFANKGAWTPDEDACLQAMVNSVGTKWTKISTSIERTPEACRLRWREIRTKDSRSGKWSKSEEKRLVEAVEKLGVPRSLNGNSTVAKQDSEGNIIAVPNRRMILDDINWESVVPYVKTRSRIQCVTKWYLRLGPTMQDRGEWDKPDDKVMLKSLWEERGKRNDLMEHEVAWDALVPGRSADQCKRRWALMRKAIKGQKDFEFPDLIVELVKTLMPKWFEEATNAK